jgi:hypothetical protein
MLTDKPTEAAKFETPAEAPEYQPSDSRFAYRFKSGACNQRYLHLATSRIPRVPISGAMERHPQPTAP